MERTYLGQGRNLAFLKLIQIYLSKKFAKDVFAVTGKVLIKIVYATWYSQRHISYKHRKT